MMKMILSAVSAVLILAAPAVHADERFNKNERDLILTILELPVWNTDRLTAQEYLRKVFPNSRIRRIEIMIEGSVWLEEKNQGFAAGSTAGTRIVRDIIRHGKEPVAEILFYY